MPEDQDRSTLKMGQTGGYVEQLHTLQGLLPGEWEAVDQGEEARFECDLGDGLPTLRIKKEEGCWVGSLISARYGDTVDTDTCDGLEAAAVYLRERLEDFADKKRRRVDRLYEILDYDAGGD